MSYTLDVYFFEKQYFLSQSLIFVDIAWKHLWNPYDGQNISSIISQHLLVVV